MATDNRDRTQAGTRPAGWLTRTKEAARVEPWFAPFALVNGAGVGLSPILLPIVAARYGVGHVGLVMGAFNLGALGAPVAGALADRFRAYRLLAIVFAAVTAVALWLFPWAGSWFQILLGLAEGAGFAGALTIGSLLIVERRPKDQWNSRLSWLETTLSLGQAGALLVASGLTGLSPRAGLGFGAIVPAAAVPLALLLIPRTGARTGGASQPEPAAGAGTAQPAAAVTAAAPSPASGSAQALHRPASLGHVGEWGPGLPTRVHRRHQAGWRDLLRGGFGWLIAAWIPAYAGTAVVFSLYPVLFLHAFGVATATSALAFAVIVAVSLPLYVLAGRVCQRRGPAATIAGSLAGRVILLAALAAFAAAGHIPAILPLAAFAGVMCAWSFLSVASPALTGELKPEAEGSAQGLLNASSGLAGLVGSVAGGLIASQWGYPAALAAG
jgi:MFS transporter, DHA1 family, tetracycline resistance protein